MTRVAVTSHWMMGFQPANTARATFDRVDAIKYEGVWSTAIVPGDNTIEVTFRWQRRWRV